MSDAVRSWTAPPSPRVRVVRYEALLESPLVTFGQTIQWLGGAPEPDRLARAVQFSSFQELRAQEQAKGFIERVAGSTAPFFGTGRSGTWRTELTPAQQARIERDHGAVMQLFGYL